MKTALMRLAILVTLGLIRICRAEIVIAPDHADGIYQPGETVSWRIEWRGEQAAPPGRYKIKNGGLKDLAKGPLVFADNAAAVQWKFDSPGTMLLEVDWEPAGDKNRAFGGAVAAPEKIAPAAPPPEDFDRFWNAKLEESRAAPLHPKLDPAESDRAGVSYWKITLDNIRGSHIRGQLAPPEKGE